MGTEMGTCPFSRGSVIVVVLHYIYIYICRYDIHDLPVKRTYGPKKIFISQQIYIYRERVGIE